MPASFTTGGKFAREPLSISALFPSAIATNEEPSQCVTCHTESLERRALNAAPPSCAIAVEFTNELNSVPVSATVVAEPSVSKRTIRCAAPEVGKVFISTCRASLISGEIRNEYPELVSVTSVCVRVLSMYSSITTLSTLNPKSPR